MRGVARLISSTRRMFVKTGPGANRSAPPSYRLEPVTSTGSRSGVPWTRFVWRSRARAIARASSVLPVPGTSSTRTWPSASSAVRIRRSGVSPPTTARPTASRRSAAIRRTARSEESAAGFARAGSVSMSVVGLLGADGDSREEYAPNARSVQPTGRRSGGGRRAGSRRAGNSRHRSARRDGRSPRTASPGRRSPRPGQSWR